MVDFIDDLGDKLAQLVSGHEDAGEEVRGTPLLLFLIPCF